MSVWRRWLQPGSRVWQGLFVLMAVAVLVLSLLPPMEGAELPTTGWDKSNHALGFAVLAWLGLQAFAGSWRRTAGVLLGLLLFGVLIEGLQSLTTYRLAEWGDLWADGVGLLIGAALHRLMFWRGRAKLAG